MLRRLFRTKSLDRILADATDSTAQLKRALGAFDVVMLGIGAIIGAGIFATIGTAVAGDLIRPGAGPAAGAPAAAAAAPPVGGAPPGARPPPAGAGVVSRASPSCCKASSPTGVEER